MAESRPDVLLTDRDMSGLDGLTLCRRLREQGQDGHTYVILLTGLGDPDEVTAGMQAGADDYLTKPLNPFDCRPGCSPPAASPSCTPTSAAPRRRWAAKPTPTRSPG